MRGRSERLPAEADRESQPASLARGPRPQPATAPGARLLGGNERERGAGPCVRSSRFTFRDRPAV